MWPTLSYNIRVAAFCLVFSLHSAPAIRVVGKSILGQDPQTVNRLNGESFQQDPLVTFNGTSGLLL